MTEKELLALCRALKIPRYMWDTEGGRAALLRLIEAARKEPA